MLFTYLLYASINNERRFAFYGIELTGIVGLLLIIENDGYFKAG